MVVNSSDKGDSVRILVVDDDPEMRFGTSRTLAKSGYEVLEAETGEEALRIALKHWPDLVLLDCVLPDQDGTDVCAKIKSIPALTNTMVVMISGVRINLEYQLQAFSKGADGYIARPIGNQELVSQVNAFVRIQRRGSSLRKRAETIAESYPKLKNDLNAEEVHRLIHEFQVYQAELEIQNEEVNRTQVELEESRDRYAALYHRAPVGYASLDEAAIIREANQTLSNMVGIPLGQLIGSPFSRWISETDQPLFHSFFPTFYRYPKGKSLDLHLWHGSEKKMIIALQGNRPESQNSPPTTGPRSGLIHVVAVDVTQQRQAEKNLQESETRYRIIAENAFNWEFWRNPEGRLLYSSPSCMRITGRSADEFIQDPDLMIKIIHPEDLYLWTRHEALVFTNQVVDNLIFRLILPDGTIRWMAHECHPVYDEMGRYIGIRGSTSDISSQWMAGQALKDSEARFRMLFDEAIDGIGLFDSETGCLLECNIAFAEMLGLEKSELLTGRSFLLIPNSDEKPAIHLSLADLRSISDEIKEITVISDSGEIRNITLKAKSATLDGQQVIQAILRDITRIRQAENTWKQLEEQLYQAQKIESASRLAGCVAHDFNNMLGIILGHADMAMDHLTPQHPVYAGLEEIHIAAERSAEMARQLMSFGYRQNKDPKYLDRNPSTAGMFIGQDLQGHETVLLIDDDPEILKIIAWMLERHGYTVLKANHPGTAIDLAAKHTGSIDLLITDVTMPEMNGREIAGKLMFRYPELKCLYVSGYADDIIARQGVLEEGVNLIQKPFSGNELMLRVREVVGS